LDFDKAIELNPKDAWAYYYNKALACEKIKKNKEAIESYKKVIELAPSQYKNPAKQSIKELQEEIEENNQ